MAQSPRIAAALLAGGLGTRLGGDTLKPFLPVLGHPLIHYSLRLFESLTEVCAIRVAVPEMHGPALERLLAPYPRRAYRGWVPGGTTRARSALAVLRALEPDHPDVVLIHDAARPLVTAEEVRDLLRALSEKDGAFLASPPVDTLWKVEGDSARATVERAELVRAFTPQAFPYATIRLALERGIEEGFEGTDDASFVTRQGGRVAWVEGSRWNIKVTYPEDLALVEAILGGSGCA
jgi:2-C-methyl-D-erythritol 4-phosphate cytidylyltransferase